VTNEELRVLQNLTLNDAQELIRRGEYQKYRRFVRLYQIVAKQDVVIPLEQLRFCFACNSLR
jgi:hypothetical protein